MRDTIALPVTESSQAGEVRRIAATLADRAGLDATGRGKVALIVTELAGNLVRHATGGEMVLSILARGGVGGFEAISIDRGPGVADFRRCLADGFSTGGTPGTGLGAVVRQADEFDVHSAVGQGTVLVARLWSSPPMAARSGSWLEIGAVCLPVAGERECGDAWASAEADPGRSLLMVVDGLGHGPKAAEAADAAVAIFRKGAGPAPADVVRAAHEALRGTRGAAIGVALVDHDRREVRFAGIGNVAATIVTAVGRHGLASHGGTVGGEVRKVQEFTQPWPTGSILVMHSDGIGTQWKLDRGMPLASKRPSVVAGALYRDHARGRDDATVLVARDGGTTA